MVVLKLVPTDGHTDERRDGQMDAGSIPYYKLNSEPKCSSELKLDKQNDKKKKTTDISGLLPEYIY